MLKESQVEDLIQTNYAIDTFYLLVMGVLVMFMACGFSMLESGMVRAKNAAEILTKNVALYAIACIMYLLIGYHIMYIGGPGAGGILPSFGFLLQDENTAEAVVASGGEAYYSLRSDYFFQVVFVATSMSIVSGAVAERMKLWAFLGFAVVMTAIIYPVQGMWSWGGGWLAEAGYSDFAGSGVVHLCGAAAALAGVLVLGPRAGKYGEGGRINAMPGCNMPLATLGMFVLWFGWFGFNGGSQLRLSNVDEANAIAQVFVNTNIAACGGLIAALVLARLWFGKADLTMALNGALAGLVSITAEPLAGLRAGVAARGQHRRPDRRHLDRDARCPEDRRPGRRDQRARQLRYLGCPRGGVQQGHRYARRPVAGRREHLRVGVHREPPRLGPARRRDAHSHLRRGRGDRRRHLGNRHRSLPGVLTEVGLMAARKEGRICALLFRVMQPTQVP